MDKDTRFTLQIVLMMVEIAVGTVCGSFIGYGIFAADHYGGSTWDRIETPVLILAATALTCTLLILNLPKQKR